MVALYEGIAEVEKGAADGACGCPYDLEVDTATGVSTTLTESVLRTWHNRNPPRVWVPRIMSQGLIWSFPTRWLGSGRIEGWLCGCST
jgi:hypothetical protein